MLSLKVTLKIRRWLQKRGNLLHRLKSIMNWLSGTIAEPLLTVIKSELSFHCIWPPDVIVKFEKRKKKVSKTVLVQSSLLVSFLASIRLGNKQKRQILLVFRYSQFCFSYIT